MCHNLGEVSRTITLNLAREQKTLATPGVHKNLVKNVNFF
jgi:hypothetical protein